MAHSKKSRIVGLLLVISSAIVAVGGWALMTRGAIGTDNAYVRADVTAVSPKVGGYVSTVEVSDNQAVRVGDVLFRIDDRDYRARLAQAEANVAAARARLANVDAEMPLQEAQIRQAQAQKRATEADLALATKTLGRSSELLRTNAVSQSLVDEKDATRDRAVAGLEAAAATVQAQRQRMEVLASLREAAVAAIDQALAARDLAAIDLDSTIVRAPVDGVVGNRQVRVGRLVSPGPSVLDIVPVKDVWLVANFKETQIEDIRPGQLAQIRVDGFPDEVFEGSVDSFAPGSGAAFSLIPPDNATGNFIRVVQRVPVKIRFVGNADRHRLVPGLSARVVIERGAADAD